MVGKNINRGYGLSKRSFEPIRKIEGKSGKVKKIVPPIDENLLSQEFLNEFNVGRLSLKSLSIVCPHCGSTLKGVHFVVFKKMERKLVELNVQMKTVGNSSKMLGSH